MNEDPFEFWAHFGVLSLPSKVIENVEVKEPDVKGLLRGDLQLKSFNLP